MLYLASSSPSRARLLKENGFDFVQLKLEYKESLPRADEKPEAFVQKVVLEKERQFIASKLFKELDFDGLKDNLLFVDSIVSVDEIILTKAHSKKEAYKMLKLQNAKSLNIISAMIVQNANKRLYSLSQTTLFLQAFNEKELEAYVENEKFKGKAGCIECEGFHKKYINTIKGHISTALGLDIPTLKAYL